ncbi:MAG: hypothetical protein KAS32_16495 [Candidatus Peribacteraceae bacterium]|nr:hypothetical protein [Candidatus Peribacteraceae bacterium]
MKVRAKLTVDLYYKKSFGKIRKNTLTLRSKVTNMCDENLQCWCNIGGANDVAWYGGMHSWDLQPDSVSSGHIKLSELINIYKDCELTINFSYNTWIEGEVGERINNIPLKFKWDAERIRFIYNY